MAATLLAVVVILAVLALAYTVFLLAQKMEAMKAQNESLTLFQQQIESLRTQLSSSLTESQKSMDNRLAEMNRQMVQSQQNVSGVVGQVQRSLGDLGAQTQQIIESTKSMASFQDLFKSPKLKGILGELFLGEILAQVLPKPHHEMQYHFKSGEAVDAVILVGGKLIPVDSKLPTEEFKRVLEAKTDEERKAARKRFIADVKKHIDSIASKYILPDEGTYDFALMYIASENIYYEMIVKDEATGEEKSLAAYAHSRRVYPVSPNSLLPYLQVIALGLRGMKVEQQAQTILSDLNRLSGDFGRFAVDFEKVGTHLGNAQKAYVESEKRLDKLQDKLTSLKAGDAALPETPKVLPPPSLS